MKKSFKKAIAVLLTMLMVFAISPFSALADTLEFSDSTSINTEDYSFILSLGNDFIANVLEGVSKDKTITVTKGETATVVFNAGEYTSSNYPDVDFSAQATGSYHYGDSNVYCIATDQAFTLTGGDVTATVSGFGAGSTGNGVYGGSYTSAVSTTFEIDTTDIEAGSHDLSLSFKYQMKKGRNIFGSVGSWSTSHEYVGTIDGIKLVVEEAAEPDTTTTALGSSIRVNEKPGLRFGFSTTAAEEEVEEYGFVYAYADKQDLTVEGVGTDGVKQLVATNKINHGDYTTFNLVFVEVPSESFDTQVSARAYVKIDGVYHYSEVKTYSFRQVAEQIIADPSIDSTTKDAVQDLLNA